MLGDVVREPSVEFLKNNLKRIIKKYDAEFCVINAENAGVNNGITPNIANDLLNAGADVLTMGNHTFRNFNGFVECINLGLPVLRPANYPPQVVGQTHVIIDKNGISIAVICLMGRLFMDITDCPYRTADKELNKIKDKAQIVLVDIHAEATGEKVAMGHYLDGRVSAVVGTHTHVQTADERILPKGTGYISDLGMVSPADSILGANIETVMKRVLTRVNQKNEKGEGKVEAWGVVLDIDENTGICNNIQRIKEVED